MEQYAFHLSLPCNDLELTRIFYIDTLGATLGRSGENWIDINLYKNQITFAKSGNFKFDFNNYRFGNQILPSFHFGIIIALDAWAKLYAKIFQMNFEITAKTIFLEGKVGEHISFFITDPNGYVLEFKSFKNKNEVF